MRNTQFLSISPSGFGTPNLAIAACLADAVGCLDLASVACLETARGDISFLRKFTDRPFAIRVGEQPTESFAQLFDNEQLSPYAVVISGGVNQPQQAWIEFCQRQGVRIFFEAVSVEEANAAISLGIDTLVLKGNESGGRVGHDTSFILLQKWNRHLAESQNEKVHNTPYFIQGGIGTNTAAAAVIAGASGIVLDAQLFLAKESQLNIALKQWLASSDGSESRCLGESIGCPIRVIHRPKSAGLDKLERLESELLEQGEDRSRSAKWYESVQTVLAEDKSADIFAFGQDVAFAKKLADRFVTVGGIISGIHAEIKEALRLAGETQPLGLDSPLAVSHGTRYPLLQGPMTRVSDTADFAKSVADAGALPFLALAVMRGNEVDKLLAETAPKLEKQSWGVGILGFLPPAIRKEQTDVILKYRPPFALIAGGRPDQAKQFEDLGIATYLHVPSPGLLKMFLREGATRFIFEGRECGGHVGPRSSFILWQSVCDVIAEYLDQNKSAKADKLHLVFAGGIHDGLSAGMVSAIAAPLASRGVKIGGLMGTAYLFTEEAVKAGAIVERFQKEALNCRDTVLLQTGPGHAIRCVKTPYYDVFESEKKRLLKEGKSHEEIVRTLEAMNIGRLRVASKGLDRAQNNQAGVRRLEKVTDNDQVQRGMYMIGQVAGMHGEITTVDKLHQQVCDPVNQRIADRKLPAQVIRKPQQPSDIAIIGMACNYPDATTLPEYWRNILRRHYAVKEVPETHWDWRLYYDPNPKAPDRIVSKWGGFLKDIPFDPLRYGITPKSMDAIEPLQLLVLESVSQALADAGYAERPFDRERTAAILGIGGGGGPKSVAYGFRTCIRLLDYIDGVPIASDEIVRLASEQLPEWTEDSFPGMLSNVTAGRVANRFNLGGPNYAIDAACASSLASLDACVRELEMGTADMAIAMGADAVQTPLAFMAFSKTHALSAKGKSRPFDAEGDGIVLAEGVGVVILKRLADAQRDGDRIYAVIKGMGASSDGKEKGLTAPNTTGQQRALRRAYEKANVSPAQLGLVEAHGTGTVVGDQTEATSLSNFMEESGAPRQSCALGSVKSMIGHSKCAAGIAGLIKTALALHHKTLPPTLVETPNPKAKFHESALYLNTEARPWIRHSDQPRSAGVSAFGFGGTNFHAVLQEYDHDYLQEKHSALDEWPSELLLWRRESLDSITAELQKILAAISGLDDAAETSLTLAGIAAAVNRRNHDAEGLPVLAVISHSFTDLQEKLNSALQKIKSGDEQINDPRGLYFEKKPGAPGKIGFLFPGQGSQYPDMLAEISLFFPLVRESLDAAARQLQDRYDRPLGQYVYPPSPFSPEERERAKQDLAQTHIAQPAIGAASLGMMNLLREFGLEPAAVAGHSYGEYAALTCAGCLSPADLISISYQRGKVINEASGEVASSMLAVDADEKTIAELISGISGVTIANVNGPRQTVVSVAVAGIPALQAALEKAKVRAQRIPVAHGFHSEFVREASRQLADRLTKFNFAEPRISVYSNTSGKAYSGDASQIVETLTQHLASPVRFLNEIETMYEDGVRVFVEVGPHHVLTNLTKQILAERPHVSVATDVKGRAGLAQLQHCLAQLMVAGVPVNVGRFFTNRTIATVNIDKLDAAKPTYPANYWMVNGVRSRPVNAGEPHLLGQPSRKKTAQPHSPLAKAGERNGSVQHHSPVNVKSETQDVGKSLPADKPAPASALNGSIEKVQPRFTEMEKKKVSNVERNGSGNVSQAHAVSQQSQEVLPQDVVECDAVMQGFQQVMAKFLETQRDVMLAYLQGDTFVAPAVTQNGNTSIGHTGNGQALNHAASGNGQTAAAPPLSNHAPSVSREETGGASPAPAVHNTSASNGSAEKNGQEKGVRHSSGQNRIANKVGASSETQVSVREQAPLSGESDDSALTREAISGELMKLVSERTGYPQDMLDLDLDLEGDLGIDSIKRVEILGSLAEFIQPGQQMGTESDINLETLSGLRTLRLILDYLQEALALDAPPARPSVQKMPAIAEEAPSQKKKPASSADAQPQLNSPSVVEAPPVAGSSDMSIRRGLVQLVESPLASVAAPLMPSGAVVITSDGQGVSEECADRLADFGITVVVIKHRDKTESEQEQPSDYVTDLTDASAVKQLVDRLRQELGEIAGIIHLLPLAAVPEQEDWVSRANRDVKSIYLLARELESDLCQASENGNAFVLSATMLGGQLGFGDERMENISRTGAGGANGFLKCVGMEWPNVLVRSIDFHPEISPHDIVDCFQAELADVGGPFEVGYKDGKRVTWEPVSAAFGDDAPLTLEISPDSTILITGGARGITAAIAAEIARDYQPTLILVGRSPMPPDEEGPETAGLEDKGEIKRAIIAKMQKTGGKVAPADVEATFKRLLADREIRENLQTIREAGATVEYHSVDVRDRTALEHLCQDVIARYGAIDGVIHGAGVIDDKLLKDKTPESFDRVFGTKVDSAMTLAQVLNPMDVKFVAFFASIASRYGNRGQSDYAAANEVLCKLAHELDRRWPARIFAVAWGPWTGLGMVSDLERHLTARGIALINREIGSRMFIEELTKGRKGECEVIIAGGAENMITPSRNQVPTESAAAASVNV